MREKSRRIIMTVSGVLLAGFSVGMFNCSAFGMDPFQVFAHGIWLHTKIGYGTFYTLLNFVMLIGVFFVDRKKIGLGTFINMFLLGYVVQFSTWLFHSWIPEPNLVQKILFLLFGLLVLCLASSLYFTGDLGVSTYDAVALILSEKTPVRFYILRVGADFICTVIGFTLGAAVGAGTIATALFMGPVITFFNNKVSIPLLYGRGKKTFPV